MQNIGFSVWRVNNIYLKVHNNCSIQWFETVFVCLPIELWFHSLTFQTIELPNNGSAAYLRSSLYMSICSISIFLNKYLLAWILIETVELLEVVGPFPCRLLLRFRLLFSGGSPLKLHVLQVNKLYNIIRTVLLIFQTFKVP